MQIIIYVTTKESSDSLFHLKNGSEPKDITVVFNVLQKEQHIYTFEQLGPENAFDFMARYKQSNN